MFKSWTFNLCNQSATKGFCAACIRYNKAQRKSLGRIGTAYTGHFAVKGTFDWSF